MLGHDDTVFDIVVSQPSSAPSSVPLTKAAMLIGEVVGVSN